MTAEPELRQLALSKMSNVLGAERARLLMERLLDELSITLATPDELARFADAMAKLGGFEGAVGAMLGVTAVMRGASRRVG